MANIRLVLSDKLILAARHKALDEGSSLAAVIEKALDGYLKPETAAVSWRDDAGGFRALPIAELEKLSRTEQQRYEQEHLAHTQRERAPA